MRPVTDARYIFPSAVEGILKGLGPRAPDLKAHWKTTGLDADALPLAIPFAQWSSHLVSAAHFAWPQEPPEEALRLLGVHFIRGWQETLMGSAAAMMLRILGPARTLSRLDRAFRTSDNFTHAVTELVDRHRARISINEVQGVPHYWIGILQGGLELLGRDGTVTLEDSTPPGAVLFVEWR